MEGRKSMLCCVLLALCSHIPYGLADGRERNQHTILFVFGANGNLATKYLWQSIFDLYCNRMFGTSELNNNNNHSLSFFGVGLSEQKEGSNLLNLNLKENIRCDDDLLRSLSSTDCAGRKRKFIDTVDYVEYTDNLFCSKFQEKMSAFNFKGDKVKVVMYMSLSTTAYVSVMDNFKKYCPKSDVPSGIDIHWVLEKPFGMDKISANSFSEKLQTSYSENEIFHVDHYLHKSVVKTILSFRYLNKNLDAIWNKDYVERVEIFLKETLDLKDRASFYNAMGVLRDIHQNHLTELLTLIAMELPIDVTNAKEISELKGDLIRHIESIKSHDSIFGQYADYANHVTLELGNVTKTSDVPTFAAVLVRINSFRWKGVPFILVSGKQLNRKESYVRIVFKNRQVCVTKCADKGSGFSDVSSRPQVIFSIHNGDLSRPAILVSKSLGMPDWPSNVGPASSDSLVYNNDAMVYLTPVDAFHTGVVIEDSPAYHSVIRDMVDGIGSHFVYTKQLLLSWHIWDSVVTASNKNVRIYNQGDAHGVLDFQFDEIKGLSFIQESDLNLYKDSGKEKYTLKHENDVDNKNMQSESPALFMGWKLVTSTSDLLPSFLANAIAALANEEVKAKGSFHLALSGGSSIAPVLHSLARTSLSLPWDSIHIWQVDERCVPYYDELSNFGMLDRELFRQVDIPFSNIHAMPVDIASHSCDESLGGAHLYTDTIKTHVINGRLDMTILGLGVDGHTASLFPGSPSLHVDSETFVTISDDGPGGSRRRMTLTLPLINMSKHVAVLVTGERKRDILQRLEESRSVDQYPILGVRPSNGTLTWYIDDLALSVQ